MSNQSWDQLLVTQHQAGTLLNTYTAAKSVINAQALFSCYPGFFAAGSTRLRHTIRGGLSNIVTTPGTVTFQIMLGSIVVWTSGAIQMNATAHTTMPFSLVVDTICQVEGSGTAAKLLGMGVLSGTQFTRTAASVDGWGSNAGFTAIANVSDATIIVPDSAPAQGTGFDSTISNILDFWVGFSISNAGNGVQVQMYDVESLN